MSRKNKFLLHNCFCNLFYSILYSIADSCLLRGTSRAFQETCGGEYVVSFRIECSGAILKIENKSVLYTRYYSRKNYYTVFRIHIISIT